MEAPEDRPKGDTSSSVKLPKVYVITYHQDACRDPRCRGCHAHKRRKQVVKGQRATP